MPVIVPAIKSQGIKTKLVPWINDIILQSGLDLPNTNWIEPFFGTGVVGLNTIVGGKRIVGDTNPHIISFYKGIQCGEITPYNMRGYLSQEGELLSKADEDGYVHFREVKKRFNSAHSSFDFIFLSARSPTGLHLRISPKYAIKYKKLPES